MHRLCREHAFPPCRPNAKPNLHGWLGDGNQLLLKKFIRKDTKLIFEFGTWLGKSAMFMLNLQANNPAFTKVVCVDTWEGDWSIKQTDKYKEHLANLYDTFIVNMWDVRERVVPVRMDGRKAMKYLHSLGLKPDLIYLDMDHSYESAKGDLECLMKYFPDTLILGDDVLYWKGVAKAVKEIVKEHNITNLEINKNCYALVPSQCSKRYHLKELLTKVIQPKEQYIDYKIGIIVGFHPRSHTRRQLHRFREHMTSFMEQTGVDFKIYVIEQHDQQQELNLGHLYNSGYEIALADGCEKFVFQDIYLLPSKALVPYYKRHNKYPIHLGYHYDKYFYEVYYLGIIMFNKENFELVNGYPINIYGLYGWDYEMVLRIKDTGLKLKLPAEGSVIPNGTHPRINVQEWRKIKTSAIINNHSETWKSNGLKNTFYTISNQRHTAKRTMNCELVSVSYNSSDYYLLNRHSIIHNFACEDNAAEITPSLVNTIDKGDMQYGFIKKDNHLFLEFNSSVDVRVVNTTFSYEYATTNLYAYSRNWKHTQKRKSHSKHGAVQEYDMYRLLPLIQSQNSFTHLRGTFDVAVFWPSPVSLTLSQPYVNNDRRTWENNLRHILNTRHQTSNINLQIYYIQKQASETNNCTPLPSGTSILTSPPGYNELKRLCCASPARYDFCVLSCLYTNDDAHNTINLISQTTQALCMTKKKGTAILKTTLDALCKETTFNTLIILRTHFEHVRLMYSCVQSGRATMVTIVCDRFGDVQPRVRKSVFALLQSLISNKDQSIRLNTPWHPRAEYICFVHQLQSNLFSNIKKILALSRHSEKERVAIERKLHKRKVVLAEQLLTSVFCIDK
jgi:predicted O-methyltransferase YrrM